MSLSCAWCRSFPSTCSTTRSGLTGISLPAYVLTSAVCMLPGAIAYTWLGYAGRSAAAGDTAALRYGLLGLGVLAMIAFLPRLFRRFRAKEPVWIESDELRRRMAAGDPVVIVDVRQPDEFTVASGARAWRRQCAARRAGWPDIRPGSNASNRSWSSARPTGALLVRQPNCWPPD